MVTTLGMSTAEVDSGIKGREESPRMEKKAANCISTAESEELMEAMTENMEPGDLQLHWALAAFEKAEASERCDCGFSPNCTLTDTETAYFVEEAEVVFQAYQTERRVRALTLLLTIISVFGCVWATLMNTMDPGKRGELASSYSEEGIVIFAISFTVISCCLWNGHEQLRKMHGLVRVANECIFAFFTLQHAVITILTYSTSDTPNIVFQTRTIGAAIFLPLLAAHLSTARIHVLIVVASSAYAFQLQTQAAAVTFWNMSYAVMTIFFACVALRREREVFINTVELKIAQRTERQSLQTQQKVEMQAYQKVVAATAHDLRTAASAMQAGCRVLTRMQAQSQQEKEGQERKDEVAVLESMYAMSEFSTHFLEGMTLSALLLDGCSVPIRLEEIDVRKIIENCIKCVELTCSSNGIVRYVTWVDDAVGVFFSDQQCVTRNLLNLLANAAKHTHEGEIRTNVSLSYESGIEQQGVYIEIAVHDTGIITNIPYFFHIVHRRHYQ